MAVSLAKRCALAEDSRNCRGGMMRIVTGSAHNGNVYGTTACMGHSLSAARMQGADWYTTRTEHQSSVRAWNNARSVCPGDASVEVLTIEEARAMGA